ncbi:MAG: ATP-binding protein [Chloroflexota bacterium]
MTQPERRLRDPFESIDAPPEPERIGPPLSFRTRLTAGLVAAAVLPLTGFGIAVLAIEAASGNLDPTFGPLVLFAIAVAAVLGVLIAYVLAADLTRPLRAIAAAVDRVSAGDLSTPIVVYGDDELARLAESHNRLADDLGRRDQELSRILAALESATPREGVEWLVNRAADDARAAFGMIDATILLGDPDLAPIQEDVPGEPRPARAILRVGHEELGILIGRLPATRAWERADQELLAVFASGIAVAIRNAQLFTRVEAQNRQLLELDAAKDDFLRGVSHNLQTPLTSIRAYADQLAAAQPDRRLTIIAEQSERLSRMVRQLLTVTRLESGALRPRTEVVALAPRVRRTWEALGGSETPFVLDDRSSGWLAVVDGDQLDQVLWALLDNAVKYGGGTAVSVAIDTDERAGRLRLRVEDRGPGVADADRDRLFGRFERGGRQAHHEGSGLGLYVSRELCRAMGGDLVLAPRQEGGGAVFSVLLPGETPSES